MSAKDNEYKTANGLCFYCSQKGHLKRGCPSKPPYRNRTASREPEPKKGNNDIVTRAVTVKPMSKVTVQKVYLDIEVNGIKAPGLVDTGCDKSLLPYKMVENVELERMDCQLYAANGTTIEILRKCQLEGKI